jgi:hypothetical protein
MCRLPVTIVNAAKACGAEHESPGAGRRRELDRERRSRPREDAQDPGCRPYPVLRRDRELDGVGIGTSCVPPIASVSDEGAARAGRSFAGPLGLSV